MTLVMKMPMVERTQSEDLRGARSRVRSTVTAHSHRYKTKVTDTDATDGRHFPSLQKIITEAV